MRLALAMSIVTAAIGCVNRPCTWDQRPATATLERVELRNTKVADAVWVVARYKVRGPLGDRLVEASAFQVFPEGTPRDVAGGKVVAYFDRHATLPSSWRHLTRGTCARDEIRIELPGCRDQRENACYELAPEQLQ